jgi:saccharopepsin
MGAKERDPTQYWIDCEERSSLPDLTFRLGGHDFVLGPEDYIFDADGECMSSLMTNGFPPGELMGVIGTVFLRKWYSIFDFGDDSISFARAKQ